MYTAANFSPNDPFEIFGTQILLLEKDSKRQVGGALLRATLIISRPSGEEPVWTRGGSWSVRWSLGIT